MASTFTGLARSGAQMIALTPNSRAAKATDWPWLPVEAEITPLVRSSSLSRLTRLTSTAGWLKDILVAVVSDQARRAATPRTACL